MLAVTPLSPTNLLRVQNRRWTVNVLCLVPTENRLHTICVLAVLSGVARIM